MWNLEQQYFEVGAHVLTIEVEDIYFLTSLSRWGAPISLTGSRGGDITTQELINRPCIPGTRKSRKKIPIKVVVDGPLCTVLFTMQRVAGNQGVHQESRAHMLYGIGYGTHNIQLGRGSTTNFQRSIDQVSAGRVEAVQFRIHFSVFLF